MAMSGRERAGLARHFARKRNPRVLGGSGQRARAVLYSVLARCRSGGFGFLARTNEIEPAAAIAASTSNPAR
jgi:hypothetical protein